MSWDLLINKTPPVKSKRKEKKPPVWLKCKQCLTLFPVCTSKQHSQKYCSRECVDKVSSVRMKSKKTTSSFFMRRENSHV